jgi:hypothetical protein
MDTKALSFYRKKVTLLELDENAANKGVNPSKIHHIIGINKNGINVLISQPVPRK